MQARLKTPMYLHCVDSYKYRKYREKGECYYQMEQKPGQQQKERLVKQKPWK